MLKSAGITLGIIGVVLVLSFALLTNPFKNSKQKPEPQVDPYVVQAPDTKLQPRFNISGVVKSKIPDRMSLEVEDSASKTVYIVVTNPSTIIAYQNLPTETGSKLQKKPYSDLVVNDEVLVIADNFAGQTTIAAKQILISKFNRVAKNIPL